MVAVKTLCSQRRGADSVPGLGTKIPRAELVQPKNKIDLLLKRTPTLLDRGLRSP